MGLLSIPAILASSQVSGDVRHNHLEHILEYHSSLCTNYKQNKAFKFHALAAAGAEAEVARSQASSVHINTPSHIFLITPI
jgi:hypothetical protein